MEPKPEEIVNTRIALLEKRMEKLEMDISEINEEMSMFRSIIHTMSETNHMQLEVRGVIYDIAPKKILGENGEVMSESNGYLEKMIRLAKKNKKIDDVLDDLDWLETYVKTKNGYIHSAKETEFILNVIQSKVSEIKTDIKCWKGE